ncbi:MAG: FeS-binding protein, partial [Flavobacteriaceae bacterium]|nr:FeS-binding protein [Flavobacteriaceae bacterium]
MRHKINHSMSLAKPDANDLTTKQKIAVVIGVIGFFILILALLNTNFPNKGMFLTASLVLISVGTLLFANDAY